ncbi:hypothetical protein BS47DRAFT_532195 [Hydnum rufescens UP504]|uniref:Uncharacterized protein n=1 Tax=Hydnum rufescens UP504 TaxID=1448309 RepID=A0A9P6E049_9AGAM|nr:hypothetical protein BS47DRAFT_532195 [Hydnum rufescens UP504]
MLDSVASTSSKFASRFKRDRGPPPVPEKDVYLPKPSSTTPYASSSFSSSSVSFSTSFIQATTSESAASSHAPSLPHHPLVSSRSMKSLRRAIAKDSKCQDPCSP